MTNMVPDEIKAAKRLHRAMHDLARERVLTQIAGNRDCLATRGGDLPHHRFGTRRIDVHHADRGALARETDRPRASHAGRRCSHQADFSCHAHSAVLLQLRPRCIQNQLIISRLNEFGCSTFGKCRAFLISA
jgi:hypothetical protein